VLFRSSDDILRIAESCLTRFALEEGATFLRFTDDAIALLNAHPWPGNVRQLENLVRRMSALYPQETITRQIVENELLSDQNAIGSTQSDGSIAADLSQIVERYVAEYFADGDETKNSGELYQRLLREVEYPMIASTLAATGGNQIKASEILGLNRNTLRKKIRDLDIKILRALR